MRRYLAHCENCGRDFTGQAEITPKDEKVPCPACGSHKTEVCAHGHALTLAEAKAALDEGTPVYWKNYGYMCFVDRLGQYLCTFTRNKNTIGMEGCGERGFFTD